MTAQTLTLADFLAARFDEDEAVARAAIDPDRPGTHWQWINSDTDTPVEAPTWEDNPSLRTVEEYPTRSVGDLPAFVINHAEADEPRALPHIARHDPARVLAECEAKRRIVERETERTRRIWRLRVDEHRRTWEQWQAEWPPDTLRDLALPYADHPDWREEWRA